MRRAALMSTVALMVAIVLPASVLAGADVGIRREVRTGAQAAFDTAILDADGNVAEGSYVRALVEVATSTTVEYGDRIETRASSLSAMVIWYEVDQNHDVVSEVVADGSTHDATITLDPTLRSGSGTGVLRMQSCDYFAEPVTCIDRGTIEISVRFTGTARMAPEPQHYTQPARFGGLYVRHGAVILRSLSATASLDGVDLGPSVWGNFFRMHQGETYVWPPRQ